MGESKKVFIGVGHGGSDPGAIGNDLRESDVNLVMAVMMKSELERHGVTVGISRTKDENDPLPEEIAEANAFMPDIAVECHNNAGGGKGFEVYRQTNAYAIKSAILANIIENHVLAIGQNSRGVKTKLNTSGTDYFGWLRQVNCPAVLCEGAFLDNTADADMINTTAKQQAFGVAYAKGVLEYLEISWKPVHDEQQAANIIYGVMKQVIALSDEEAAKKYAAEMQKEDPAAYWFITKKSFNIPADFDLN